MTTAGPPPPQDPPPTRDVWFLLVGLLVCVPLVGLLLLAIPLAWKGVILCVLVVVLLVLLRRMIRRSRHR